MAPATGAWARKDCRQTPAPFWQITTTRSQMPKIFTQAYRMSAAGVIEYARWDNDRKILEMSPPARLAEATGSAFRNLVERGVRNQPASGGPGPTSESVEMGAYPSPEARYSAAGAVPSDVAAFLEQLTARLPKSKPDAGHYLWTKPVARAGVVDIDLADADCDEALPRAISTSLAAPQLLVRLDEGGAAFTSGELASRYEFGAQFPGGYAHYGVVQT